MGLPTERLAPALRAVLAGTSPSERFELEAINRRGRAIVVATSVLPLISGTDGDGGPVHGAIILMEDGDGARPG